LVRRLAGVAGDHLELGERQVELLRRDLRQRREDALAELDLAGEHRRGAVGIDAKPGIEPAVGLQAARQSWWPGLRLRQDLDWRKRKGQHDAAHAFGKAAARQGRSVHDQVLPSSLAARSTAPMMRLWVPQRQRLPASAVRTSASLAPGLRSSSSLADMI